MTSTTDNTQENLPKQQQSADIQLTDGKLQSASLNALYRAATLLTKSGILPKAYSTPEQTCAGMLYALELGLPPITSLRNIAVINGMPSVWGELPLAMVRNSGKLEYIKEYLLDKTGNVICMANKNLTAEIEAAVCVVKRKGEEEREFFYTSLDAAKNPNANNPNNNIWKSYRSIMMKRKARGLAIKDVFGDVITGMSIAEYDNDSAPDLMNVDGVQVELNKETNNARLERLNKKFSSEVEDVPPPVPQEEI